MVVWGIKDKEQVMSSMPGTTSKYRYTKDKASLLARMKRIEGQAGGIRRMLEDDRYCIEIIQQLTALSAAADEVSLLILESHIEGCVASAIREQHGEDYIKELIRTMRKAIRR